MRALWIGPAALLAALLPWAPADTPSTFEPPSTKQPDAATRRKIDDLTRVLRAAVAGLQKRGVKDPVLADVEVHLKAAEWIVKHNEFYHADAGKWTVQVLEQGLKRAESAARGESPWQKTTGTSVVRGYRSKVDGSVQPYAITYPAEYGKKPGPWRVDVVLHGRDSSLTEVKFLHQHSSGKPAPPENQFVQIDVYGRGNNAYRWAGETDVFEVIHDAFERAGDNLDKRRLVLRGFSMGGAGAWHLGLQHPDKWCVIGPGAGFTTTRGYVKNLPDPLPPYVAACLHIYDAVDYAENAAMVPVVAYAGDKDPQIAAGRAVEKRLKELGIPMTFLIAPGLEHKMLPEWQKMAEEEYEKYAGPGKGRLKEPKHVSFTTYTPMYRKCEWVTVDALEHQYAPAHVDATVDEEGCKVKTKNVRTLVLNPAMGGQQVTRYVIDGQEFRIAADKAFPLFHKKGGRWAHLSDDERWLYLIGARHKSSAMAGPIDYAFTDSFLCVRGTGRPWHPAVGRYADADLKRFAAEWDKYMRGTLPIKDDIAISSEEMLGKNLILFGDPASNRVIADMLEKLPLKWAADKLEFAGQSYDPARHLPVMIFPTRFPARYVVLNSGHTFHAADFQGSNALLYPRLGDYAVLKLPEPGAADPLAATVETAGLFDDDWRLPAK